MLLLIRWGCLTRKIHQRAIAGIHLNLRSQADDTPDPGTVINDQAHYLQLGGMLFVMYNFEKT